MILDLSIIVLNLLTFVNGVEYHKDTFRRVFVPDDKFVAVKSFDNIRTSVVCGAMCLSNKFFGFRYKS